MSVAARKRLDLAMTALCGAALLAALLPLASILWLVISNGWRGLSLDFFTQLPKPMGESGGGVANAIVGSLFMVALAAAVGVPAGVGAGVYLAEQRDSRLADGIRFTAEVLSGVPSIVIGIVAYGLVVRPMGRFSGLAGAAALSVLMVPGLARSTEELVRLVPHTLREAALALGASRFQTSLFIVLRTALPGILTAILVALARALGETAPLLLTALNNQFWSLRPDQPMASLTVQIFNYAISPYDDWHDKAWTAALVLLLLVGGLSLAARALSRGRFRGGK